MAQVEGARFGRSCEMTESSLSQGQITMFKVQASYEKPRIKPVAILKKTEHFVTYMDDWCGRPSQRRERIEGTYFDSWEAAKVHLVENAERRVRSYQSSLDIAKSELAKVRELAP
jgi:hypothetical protein